MNGTNTPPPIFPGLSSAVSTDLTPIEEIESYCTACTSPHGTTRLLLTKIPFFREVILSSFSCPACGAQNSEIQSAGEIQPRGSRIGVRCTSAQDLSRQVLRGENASCRFEELDVEVPPLKGQLTNVEGLLRSFVEDIGLGQETRRTEAPEAWEKIEGILARAREYLDEGEGWPLTFSIDDPSGNSWVERHPRDGAGIWWKTEYDRTRAQNETLGLSGDPEPTTNGEPAAPLTNGVSPHLTNGDTSEIIPDEIYAFPASCPGCTRPCTTNMQMLSIPHFKEVVLMATNCDSCGYRSNEVKTGGAVPEKAKRITLRVRGPDDLKRDVLKSESATLECDELGLHVAPGTLGGRFTTLEGLLKQIGEDLKRQVVGGEDGEGGGDSAVDGERERWDAFFAKLEEAVEGRMPFSVRLEDPMAGSYIQRFGEGEEGDDEQLVVEEYERTAEEEEELGLRDLRTDGYREGDGDPPP